MSSFTLDDIRAAAKKKYASTDITLDDGTTLVLLNAMRLPKAKRQALIATQDRLSDEAADQEAILCDAIRLIAENATQAEKFINLVGEDLTVLSEVFSRYTGETQAGEALASQD